MLANRPWSYNYTIYSMLSNMIGTSSLVYGKWNMIINFNQTYVNVWSYGNVVDNIEFWSKILKWLSFWIYS